MSFKVILRTDRLNQRGEASICLRLIISRKRKLIALGLKCVPSDFDETKQRITLGSYRTEINEKIEEALKKASQVEAYFTLHDIKSDVESFASLYIKGLDGEEPPKESIPQPQEPSGSPKEISTAPPKPGVLTNTDERHFYDVWDKFMKYYRAENEKSTWSRMPNHLKKLEDFCKHDNVPITFGSFTKQFGVQFKYYLYTQHYNYITKERGVSQNTCYNIIKQISTFLNWALEEEYHDNLDFKKWRISKPKTDLQYLKEEQLFELFNYSLSPGKSWDKTRDAWCFMAFSGMRISDYERFHPSWVIDGVIDFYSEKARKKCIVPLNPVTKYILDKYGGEVPRINNAALNENIKLILADMGYDKIQVKRTIAGGKKDKIRYLTLAQSITVHSARRSFINLMICKGVQINDLGTMTGNDISSLMIYYKQDTQHIKRVMDSIQFRVAADILEAV